MHKEAISYFPPEAQSPLREVRFAPITPIRPDVVPEPNDIEEGTMPMAYIPLGPERAKLITDRDIFVSQHELGHALLAYQLGMAIEEVSIIPKPGVYEGITRLKGPFNNLKNFQVVSAGGAVATGSEHGAGSDKAKIHAIHEQYGGHSVEEAFAAASSLLSNLTPDERKLAAEILAWKKSLSGGDIPELIRRVKYEVKKGLTPQEIYDIQQVQNIQYSAKEFEAIHPNLITTRVFTQIDGVTIEYEEINGQVDERTIAVHCPVCKLPTGHAPDCPKKNISYKKILDRQSILFDKSISGNLLPDAKAWRE